MMTLSIYTKTTQSRRKVVDKSLIIALIFDHPFDVLLKATLDLYLIARNINIEKSTQQQKNLLGKTTKTHENGINSNETINFLIYRKIPKSEKL